MGGTASVVGEDSLHPGALPAQLAETRRNLAAVVRAAGGAAAGALDDGAALAELVHLRAYVVRPGDVSEVAADLQHACPRAGVETLVAELCRPELLVEVEAVTAADHLPEAQPAGPAAADSGDTYRWLQRPRAAVAAAS